MRALFVLVSVLVASVASAQKPVGLFDPGTHPPAWASFGTISDTVSDERLREAAAMSRSRPFSWLLQVGYHEHPADPIGPHAARVRARRETAGLLPHVVAMSVGEEWYEHFLAGNFERFGLPASSPEGIAIIHDWMGRQHAAAAAALGLPVVWITTVAHPTLRPIPAGVDLVAIDAYVPRGGTFDIHVAPLLRLAEDATALPLVLIPQWFTVDDGGQWSHEPHEADIQRYTAWFQRPRWVAMLGFTWQDRPSIQLRGLAGMPAVLAAVERSLGVR